MERRANRDTRGTDENGNLDLGINTKYLYVPSPPRKHSAPITSSYASILLSDVRSDNLVQKFLAEDSGLRMSDARGIENRATLF